MKVLIVHWNDLHHLARAELADNAAMRVADWYWHEMDGWMQDILRDQMTRRSGGRIRLEA